MADPLKWDFTADRPGVKFAGDTTCIHPRQGYFLMVTVIDC
jgi:hypothetical protein